MKTSKIPLDTIILFTALGLMAGSVIGHFIPEILPLFGVSGIPIACILFSRCF